MPRLSPEQVESILRRLGLLSIEVGDIGKSARRSTSYMTSLTRLCPRRFRKTGLGPLGT
jgi:hypothetical protein